MLSPLLVVQCPVQTNVSWIRRIELLSPVGEEPPVLGVMKGYHEPHALLSDGLLEFSHDIAFRAHLDGAPLGELAIPHREAIMVFPHGTSELGAGSLEELCPLLGVELVPREHGDEILVAKF